MAFQIIKKFELKSLNKILEQVDRECAKKSDFEALQKKVETITDGDGETTGEVATEADINEMLDEVFF